jgi:transposase InsO family protein
VAKALLHHWIYRFSIPKQIHSDQGKEFCNKVLQELFSLLGTTHTTTTAYHPQANAQVERLIQTIPELPAGPEHGGLSGLGKESSHF